MSQDIKTLLPELKRLAEAATPGPWAVNITEHPHYLGGKHKERQIFTQQKHPQLGAPFPIVALSLGLPAAEGDPAIALSYINQENADYIAAANPATMLALVAHIEALERQLADLRQAPDGTQTVHEWFELTYAQFLTLPRVIMDAMPLEWQFKMTALLNEMDAQFDWLPANGRQYYVRVADSIEWPYEDEDGNPIEPVLLEPDSDLCNYRHPRIEHRRKSAAPSAGQAKPAA